MGPQAALPRLAQQINILESLQNRFESSLFDIRQLTMADLFDSELASAQALAKAGFGRAAGAVAGVVLESHLAEVSGKHAVKISKAHPTISIYNEALKAAAVIEVETWRFIQRLGDLRNLCDHKGPEPTSTQILDLLDGVAKIIKTVF